MRKADFVGILGILICVFMCFCSVLLYESKWIYSSVIVFVFGFFLLTSFASGASEIEESNDNPLLFTTNKKVTFAFMSGVTVTVPTALGLMAIRLWEYPFLASIFLIIAVISFIGLAMLADKYR